MALNLESPRLSRNLTRAETDAWLAPPPSSSSGAARASPAAAAPRTPAAAAAAPFAYSTVAYDVADGVATITLNRPARGNAIDLDLPFELRHAVIRANMDSAVRVIVVCGAGKGFCGGYDLKIFAESARGDTWGSQTMPWDPAKDFQGMSTFTECYMSLFHSMKPTIAKVHGFAVAGGSDIALCCDLVVMAENARIGYPPARVWGVPTTAMWAFRVGAEKAKELLFTGKLLSGREAADIGLVLRAVPRDALDAAVAELVRSVKSVPSNQLFFHKAVVNQMLETQGLRQAQRLSTFLDGASRHTPEGVAFQELSRKIGFKEAIRVRDGPLAGGDERAAPALAPRPTSRL